MDLTSQGYLIQYSHNNKEGGSEVKTTMKSLDDWASDIANEVEEAEFLFQDLQEDIDFLFGLDFVRDAVSGRDNYEG